MPIYKYHLAGYIFATNFGLPELIEANGNAVCSLMVLQQVSSMVPVHALTMADYYDDDLQLICLQRKLTGTVCIWDRKKFEYVPYAHLSEQDIRVQILSTLAMLMSTLQGYTVFHAACVIIKERAVLFCGRSGMGKSTLAAYFDAKDYVVFSDDVAYVKISADGVPFIYPSVPKIKIDKTAFDFLGRTEQNLKSLPGTRNRSLLPTKGNYQQLSYRLHSIYFLDYNSEETKIQQIGKSASVINLGAYLFRKGLLKSLHLNDAVKSGRLRILATIPMFTFSRPHDPSQMMENMLVAEHQLNRIILQAPSPLIPDEI